VILGAGGKMGPTLARMAKRANPERRVIAVSRWSDRSIAESLNEFGVETLRVDLLDPTSRAALPDAPNVVFMAGQKFGTKGNPATTWAMNAAVPAHVSERYGGARTVVFSTGNVYALTTPESGGSREDDVLAPIGEYAFSCLARERIFSDASARHGTPVAIVRLNYAHDLRYGVLTDLAVRIVKDEPIDLRMSCVNVIWQGDANALALSALTRATSPEPYIVNVAGREVPCVEDLAKALGRTTGQDADLHRSGCTRLAPQQLIAHAGAPRRSVAAGRDAPRLGGGVGQQRRTSPRQTNELRAARWAILTRRRRCTRT
jgi:nucleoside-diphosphate-sugar epimerase